MASIAAALASTAAALASTAAALVSIAVLPIEAEASIAAVQDATSIVRAVVQVGAAAGAGVARAR